MEGRPQPAALEGGRRHWCILGAGPSGLVAMKELREVGIATTCFELLPRLGGVFAKSYDGLLMTSSNVITQFSSYSDGEEAAPRHWTGPEYLAYLEAFAARYGLEDGIRFRTRVLDVRRCDASGKWLVTYRHEPAQPDGDGGAAPPAAGTATEAFDGVAVCAGAHNWPRAPPVEGAERFGGPIIHSAEVKDMAPFAGKRVAVIGAGESGSDLANMVSKVAASVCVVVRGAHGHLIARNAAVGAGHPNDMNTNRARYSNPLALGGAIESVISLGKQAQARFLVASPATAQVMTAMLALNKQQGTNPFNKYGSKSSGFVEAAVLRGARLHRGDYTLEPGRVAFADGSPPFEADVILAATGFTQRLPFLEGAHPELAAKYANPRLLYQQVFTPEFGAEFAFLGTARPAFGAIPPLSELQARRLAAAITGAAPLPPRAEMEAAAARDAAAWRARFPSDGAISALVDHQAYADSLAASIGALPPLGLSCLLRDPVLWWKLMFGPLAAAQYRLRGPGADPEAARASLMHCPDGAVLECAVSFAFLLLAKLLSGLLGLQRFAPLNF